MSAKSVIRFVQTVCILLTGLAIGSCSDEKTDVSGINDFLIGTTWQIESVDNGGIIDNSMITLQFVDATRIAGNTGCNRYFGAIQFDTTTDNSAVTISGLGSTRRACAPALMNQEQRVLSALESTQSFVLDKDIWLLSFDADNNERLKMIQIDKDPTAAP